MTAYAFVQKKSSVNGAAQSTTALGVFDAPVAASNCLAVFHSYFYNPATPDITVVRNGVTLTQVGSARNDSWGLWWGYEQNTTAGDYEVVATANVSGSPVNVDAGAIVALEYSGLAPTGTILLGTNNAYLTSPTNATDGWSTGNITPAAQPGALICAGWDLNAANLVPGTGFSANRATWADFNLGIVEDKRIAALSAIAGLMTGGVGDYGHIAAMILAEASPPAGLSVTQLIEMSRPRVHTRM